MNIDNRPLFISDLPNQIVTENGFINVTLLDNQTAFLTNDNRHNFMKTLLGNHAIGDGLLFMTFGCTFSILWNKRNYFIFDSHSRGSEGTVVENGNSILLKFCSLLQLQIYIYEVYFPMQHSISLQFEVQFISLEKREIAIANVPCPVVKDMTNCKGKKESTRQRKIVQHENIKGIELHEQQKKKDRKRKADEFLRNAGTLQHEIIKNKRRGTMQIHRELQKILTCTLNNKTSDERINKFRCKIKQGPYFICVCCERGHYEGATVLYNPDKYQIKVEDRTSLKATYNSKHYICKTCHTKLKNNKTPCQAVWNKLEVDPLPGVLESLHKLEKAIICKRILFSKVMIMPKGQMPKIKGSICNVPIGISEVHKILPRGADSNGLISVKLKRKLAYRGHVYFEPVRPEHVLHALEFLKANNPLYQDVVIAIEQIASELVSTDDDIEQDQTLEILDDNLKEIDNPLDNLRVGSTETMLISNIPYSIEQENIISAPGENKKPLSLMKGENCKALAFPYLFPRGKFGYNVERDVPLNASKYFNQRLLNYTQRFAGISDYIFYAHSVLQQKQLTSNINMTMKKVQTNNLTAGMLSSNFQETVTSFIAKDEVYNFMNTIKGTPAYWKRFLFEVLGMVKQLDLPTFFMTLSCADLRWNELVEIITKLGDKYISDEDIENLSYFERCAILNMNPVLLEKHFQYRVEVFFKEIVVDGPLGKVTYHAIRVEFQFRGSPHIHFIFMDFKCTQANKG